MYDINTTNIKKGKNIFYLFLIIGILILIFVVFIYISSIIKFKSLDSTILSSEVEVKTHIDNEGKTMYSPVYYYEVDGSEYTCGSNSSSSVNPGTQNKTVYYDSKDPTNCMTEYSKSGNNIILLFSIIPIVFITAGVINIKKVNKRVKAIMELNQKGKLIKNLPYRLENSGTIVNGVPIKMIVVDYKLSTGSIIALYSDARYDKKNFDSDGMVDLLIDESNPNNYFIDFEINRLSGNQTQDYFQTKAPAYTTNQNVQEQVYNSQNNKF